MPRSVAPIKNALTIQEFRLGEPPHLIAEELGHNGTESQRRRFARDLAGVAFVVGGLTLAGCGSSAGDNGATSSGGESGGQADSEPSEDLSDAEAELEEIQESDSSGAATCE